MFEIDTKNTDIVGLSTPDPLRFAFSRKRSAHAGGHMDMVPPPQVQQCLAEALGNNSAQKDIGAPRCLYIHIPFCRVRCTYCNFFQYASSKQLMESYFEALLAEIRWKAAMTWTQAQPFQAVYVGGGTPTDLSALQLEQLGKAIRANFPLTADCEITLEGRVNRFGKDKFESALEGGFNRFSFGVQSFDNHVRRSAKRLDDKDYVIETLQSMMSYNAAPIVIDLLYGLPYQNLENWQTDLETYLEVGVDGVDLYQLIEMKGLPMERAVAQGKLPYPADTPTKASMFQMGVEFMAKHHQRRLSVNHWASTNRERSIYNSLAKTTAEVLPIGAGAGGNVGGLNMMQHRDMDKYIEAIQQKNFPVGMVMRSSPDRAITSYVKSVMDRGVLSKKGLNTVAEGAFFEGLRPLFMAWHQNGLIRLSEDYVELTLAGEFWATTLAQNLIQVIQTGAGKPSPIPSSMHNKSSTNNNKIKATLA